MQFELLTAAADDSRIRRRSTTLHLMIAIALCGTGAMLLWFAALARAFGRITAPQGLLSTVCILAGLGIAALTVFRRSWLIQGKAGLRLRLFEVALMAAAAICFAATYQWKAAAIFSGITLAVSLAAVYEGRPAIRQTILIDEEGITLPRLGASKMYRWADVESLLVRHGILSIELTGNRLVQRELATLSDIDRASIESFAKNQITARTKERAENAPW